ncbi:MAG: isoleucine--tRNA ligase [Candidatus Pacebacteria bacterium]|nr:isoleucine--tRNA ligase [Candidatus Paceibacterota bacterium]
MFASVPSNVSFPEIEHRILNFWDEAEVFQKSLDRRRDCDPYVFYDGPPFATGLPHYGHLLAGTIKDVIPRYQTMRGKYVPRTFGWDCHGLPVENEMEKELGISSRHEIEEYGVARFNEDCRSIVLRYTKEWEELVRRIGRWVDFENGYRTMDMDYMESIWWVFKQLWDKGLIYEGHKILPYCPRCATPLSNFEANQGYENVQDPAITVRFASQDDCTLYFLAWTTTPWTLPSNLALAVNADVDYVRVHDNGTDYVLAADRVSTYYPDREPQIVARFPGSELAGKRYQPLFPYFAHLGDKGAFRVITADFVTTEEGTGIVHVAPGFGEDDAKAAKEHGIPVVCPIDAECRFDEDIIGYTGRAVKDTDKDLIRQLKKEGKLVHQSTCEHSYPHCWRCETPLIYRAVSTWFVHVEQIKDQMLAANQQIHWVPEHLRDGRFGKWLENAHDWAISRNRYWGCPLPVWRSEDLQETRCIGSVRELEELTGRTVEDIHKHYVDELHIPSEKGGAPLKRVPEVLDCWFESGSMPYAEHHYPFENKAFVEKNFPADFIAEGLDQTRGWFYTLVVIGTALFEKPPFLNVVVNGLVLAEDGKKMSKRLKNYPDPKTIMDQYGADALRLTLLSSPVVRAEDLRFSEHAVREVMRTVILPVWNAYSFLVTYARVDAWEPQAGTIVPPTHPKNALDRWILSRVAHTVQDVQQTMDAYELQRAATRFTELIQELTNWYIRRSRRRFWKSQNDTDKAEAYATLHYVLVTFSQIAAPFIPLVTEEIYRNLRTEPMPESVHLCNFPTAAEEYRDEELDQRMSHTMTAVTLGRHLRTQASLRVRQPLPKAILVSASDSVRRDLKDMQDVIADELNVKTVDIRSNEEELVHLSAKANFRTLGPRFGSKVKALAPAIARLDADTISRLRNGEDTEITVGDECVRIGPHDIVIQRDEKEGMTVANEGAITVALDTRLTKKLVQEGMARELVSKIQNMRKDIGLEVTDRISIKYDAGDELENAIEIFGDYIAKETLALNICKETVTDAASLDIDGAVCRLVVKKAS